jgi:predicted nucleic acid-binding protein
VEKQHNHRILCGFLDEGTNNSHKRRGYTRGVYRDPAQLRNTVANQSSQNQRVRARIADHQRAGRWIMLPLPERAFDVCADLARRHGLKLGVRLLDSLHVACALELKADRFWTLDDRQAKLAKAEGLKIS